MRRIRLAEPRQFYIRYRDGRTEDYGKPKILKSPDQTKDWKRLQRMISNDDIECVGWRTVKV